MNNRKSTVPKKQMLTLLSKKESTFDDLRLVMDLSSTEVANILKELESNEMVTSFWKKEIVTNTGKPPLRFKRIYIINNEKTNSFMHNSKISFRRKENEF